MNTPNRVSMHSAKELGPVDAVGSFRSMMREAAITTKIRKQWLEKDPDNICRSSLSRKEKDPGVIFFHSLFETPVLVCLTGLVLAQVPGPASCRNLAAIAGCAYTAGRPRLFLFSGPDGIIVTAPVRHPAYPSVSRQPRDRGSGRRSPQR